MSELASGPLEGEKRDDEAKNGPTSTDTSEIYSFVGSIAGESLPVADEGVSMVESGTAMDVNGGDAKDQECKGTPLARVALDMSSPAGEPGPRDPIMQRKLESAERNCDALRRRIAFMHSMLTQAGSQYILPSPLAKDLLDCMAKAIDPSTTPPDPDITGPTAPLNPEEEMLMCAKYSGTAKTMQSFFDSTCNPRVNANAADSDGNTALHLVLQRVAAFPDAHGNGHPRGDAARTAPAPTDAKPTLDIVTTLLGARAEVNNRNFFGVSVLESAVIAAQHYKDRERDWRPVVELLLDSKAQPDGRSLGVALAANDVELVESLLRHRADPESIAAVHTCRDLPLSFAVSSPTSDPALVAVLINARADLTTRRPSIYAVMEDAARIYDAAQGAVSRGAVGDTVGIDMGKTAPMRDGKSKDSTAIEGDGPVPTDGPTCPHTWGLRFNTCRGRERSGTRVVDMHSISLLPEFRNMSFEEIRYSDYKSRDAPRVGLPTRTQHTQAAKRPRPPAFEGYAIGSDGWTAAEAAVAAGTCMSLRSLSHLVREARSRNIKIITPRCAVVAVQSGNLQLARRLIEAGRLDINQVAEKSDPCGRHVLEIAIAPGDGRATPHGLFDFIRWAVDTRGADLGRIASTATRLVKKARETITHTRASHLSHEELHAAAYVCLRSSNALLGRDAAAACAGQLVPPRLEPDGQSGPRRHLFEEQRTERKTRPDEKCPIKSQDPEPKTTLTVTLDGLLDAAKRFLKPNVLEGAGLWSRVRRMFTQRSELPTAQNDGKNDAKARDAADPKPDDDPEAEFLFPPTWGDAAVGRGDEKRMIGTRRRKTSSKRRKKKKNVPKITDQSTNHTSTASATTQPALGGSSTRNPPLAVTSWSQFRSQRVPPVLWDALFSRMDVVTEGSDALALTLMPFESKGDGSMLAPRGPLRLRMEKSAEGSRRVVTLRISTPFNFPAAARSRNSAFRATKRDRDAKDAAVGSEGGRDATRRNDDMKASKPSERSRDDSDENAEPQNIAHGDDETQFGGQTTDGSVQWSAVLDPSASAPFAAWPNPPPSADAATATVNVSTADAGTTTASVGTSDAATTTFDAFTSAFALSDTGELDTDTRRWAPTSSSRRERPSTMWDDPVSTGGESEVDGGVKDTSTWTLGFDLSRGVACRYSWSSAEHAHSAPGGITAQRSRAQKGFPHGLALGKVTGTMDDDLIFRITAVNKLVVCPFLLLAIAEYLRLPGAFLLEDILNVLSAFACKAFGGTPADANRSRVCLPDLSELPMCLCLPETLRHSRAFAWFIVENPKYLGIDQDIWAIITSYVLAGTEQDPLSLVVRHLTEPWGGAASGRTRRRR